MNKSFLILVPTLRRGNGNERFFDYESNAPP